MHSKGKSHRAVTEAHRASLPCEEPMRCQYRGPRERGQAQRRKHPRQYNAHNQRCIAQHNHKQKSHQQQRQQQQILISRRSNQQTADAHPAADLRSHQALLKPVGWRRGRWWWSSWSPEARRNAWRPCCACAGHTTPWSSPAWVVARTLVLRVGGRNAEEFERQSAWDVDKAAAGYLNNPERLQPQQEQTGGTPPQPTVRVRLSVHYRVHSRQMLCIGGSQIPFGWSFLSIAKVPMTWNQGDVWTCELDLPPGQIMEYKYVILEEQDWTKLENESAEGLVQVTYRTGTEPGRPPDIQVIQKQMAIVAWQPGPNRIVQVPTEAEVKELQPGQVVERIPATPTRRISYEPASSWRKPNPFEGTWEILSVGQDRSSFLDRHDVWGWLQDPQIKGPDQPGKPGS